MTNCEAIAYLDHIMKTDRDSPEELRIYEDAAILKGIMELYPKAQKEEDFERNREFFEKCCIKDEVDFVRLHRNSPLDAKSVL